MSNQPSPSRDNTVSPTSSSAQDSSTFYSINDSGKARTQAAAHQHCTHLPGKRTHTSRFWHSVAVYNFNNFTKTHTSPSHRAQDFDTTMNLSDVSTSDADVTAQLFGAGPHGAGGKTVPAGNFDGDTTLINISQSTLNFLLDETKQQERALAEPTSVNVSPVTPTVTPATPTVTPATPLVTAATPPVLDGFGAPLIANGAADPQTTQPQAPPRPSIAATVAPVVVMPAVEPKAAPMDTVYVLDDDSVIELSSDEGICYL